MAKLIVVKVGTSIVTKNTRLRLKNLTEISKQIAFLKKKGLAEPLIVTSGAIGLGMAELGHKKKPSQIPKQQAAAAIGQSTLIEAWKRILGRYGLRAGQALPSESDFHSKTKMFNLTNCIRELLRVNAIPVINENDVMSTEELKRKKKFSDNDGLSREIAIHLSAWQLLILTDSKPHSGIGAGGMLSKVEAAMEASDKGVKTTIIPFPNPIENVIIRAVTKGDVGNVYNPPKPKN
jgi:glutamate 5-kinase